MKRIKCKSRLAKQLVTKSIEAFILGIETFNKPTITYRVEAFSYLICNAWELLFKAYLIETHGKDSIYFNDKKDKSRTKSLSGITKEIITNEHDPVRMNLLSILELRDASTHFITQEYESLYAPLFQASVNNYINRISLYFDVNIDDYIKFPFLVTSSYSDEITPEAFKKRYGKKLFEHYIKNKTTLEEQIENAPNDKFAIGIDIKVTIVKNANDADIKMAIDKNSTDKVHIIKEYKDVNTSFPFNQKRGIANLNEKLHKANIKLTINQYSFQLICNYFHLYDDPSMCYKVVIDKNPRKMFSNKMIDFIFEEIKKDNNIVNTLRKKKNS